MSSSVEYGPITNERLEFVNQYIAPVTQNPQIHRAMEVVDRRAFVPAYNSDSAYKDIIHPYFDRMSSVSQPSLVAEMMDYLVRDYPQHPQLSSQPHFLEIGTASGLQAAYLQVYGAERIDTIDRDGELVESAKKRLSDLHFDRVFVHKGDGALGVSQNAPYDGILVTAGLVSFPQIYFEQLAVGGRIVAPVGSDYRNQLLCVAIKGQDDQAIVFPLKQVAFYPLISEHEGGWTTESMRNVDRVKLFVLIQEAQEVQQDLEVFVGVIAEKAGSSKEADFSSKLSRVLNMRFPEYIEEQYPAPLPNEWREATDIVLNALQSAIESRVVFDSTQEDSNLQP